MTQEEEDAVLEQAAAILERRGRHLAARILREREMHTLEATHRLAHQVRASAQHPPPETTWTY